MAAYKPPRPIRELAEESRRYVLLDKWPYEIWLRSANTVYETAKLMEEKKEYPEAYVYYLRFIDIMFERIHQHPKFVDRSSYTLLTEKARKVAVRVDGLVPLIEKEIQEYECKRALRKKQAAEKQKLQRQREKLRQDVESSGAQDLASAAADGVSNGSAANMVNEDSSVQFKRNFSDLSTNTGLSLATATNNNSIEIAESADNTKDLGGIANNYSLNSVPNVSLNSFVHTPAPEPTPRIDFAQIPILNVASDKSALPGTAEAIMGPKIQANPLYNGQHARTGNITTVEPDSEDEPDVSRNDPKSQDMLNDINNRENEFEDEFVDNSDGESSIMVPAYPKVVDEPSLIKMYKSSNASEDVVDQQQTPSYQASAANASTVSAGNHHQPTLTPKPHAHPVDEHHEFSHSPITVSSPQKPPKIRSVEQIRSIHSSSESRPSNDDLKSETIHQNNGTSVSIPKSTSYYNSSKGTVPSTQEALSQPFQLNKQTPLHHSSNGSIPADTNPIANHGFSSFTEGGAPLRTVYVPAEIQTRFTKIAAANTAKNLETCGVLCGALTSGTFFITDLIVPDQLSTQNTCLTINEENVIRFVEENGLYILGWIHTHPTQSCFLSSVDLHTQYGYQRMLAESIAIVVAPKLTPDFGIFRLSDPYGINLIENCKLANAGFHPHSEDGLYDICARSRGGHVVVKRDLPLEITDIRTD